MIDGFVGLDRIRSAEELKEVEGLAAKDAHGVFAPTMLLKKDGKTVGYISLNHPTVAMALAWFSMTEMHARESFHVVNAIESVAALVGNDYFCWPIPKVSPFYKNMESLGYKNIGTYDLFIKKL